MPAEEGPPEPAQPGDPEEPRQDTGGEDAAALQAWAGFPAASWEPEGPPGAGAQGPGPDAGHAPWGTPGGDEAPEGPEAGAAPPGPQVRRAPEWLRRGRVAAAIVLASAIVGGGAGAGVAAALRGGTTIVETFGANTSLPPKTMDIQAVLARVMPAVVSVTARSTSSSGGSGFPFNFFGPSQAQSVVDEGTGMVLTSSGEVLTNNHVIAGATSISVTLSSSSSHKYDATVIGADPTDDLALLQVHGAPPLPTVTLGDSAKTQVGDAVIAIGNALGLAGGPTVTNGIISAEGRTVTASDSASNTTETLTDMLQTDAAINSGNSGGPLVDAQAQVIGMNTAVAGSSGPGNAPAQNIGFAIPTNKIKSLLPLLRRGGTIAQGHGYMGVEVVTLTASLRNQYGFTPNRGAVIVSVLPGSPADSAGLEPGDVIVDLGSHLVTSAESLTLAVTSYHPGQKVRVRFWRGDIEHSTEITLGSQPTTLGG